MEPSSSIGVLGRPVKPLVCPAIWPGRDMVSLKYCDDCIFGGSIIGILGSGRMAGPEERLGAGMNILVYLLAEVSLAAAANLGPGIIIYVVPDLAAVAI